MIDRDKIQKIAQLAKLHLTEEEAQDFSKQLSKSLEYFDQISKIPTEGVEPLVTPIEIESAWREDQVIETVSPEETLSNAPEKTGRLLTVPPAVG